MYQKYRLLIINLQILLEILVGCSNFNKFGIEWVCLLLISNRLTKKYNLKLYELNLSSLDNI